MVCWMSSLPGRRSLRCTVAKPAVTIFPSSFLPRSRFSFGRFRSSRGATTNVSVRESLQSQRCTHAKLAVSFAYLLGVEVTALMLSSPSASSPHAQSQSPPQPPVLHSPA